MIVGAFAAGDKDRLRPLLSDEVYTPFAAAIDERVAARETLETRIVGLKRLDIVEAGLTGRIARVTVKSSPIRSMCCAPMTAASSTAIPTTRSKRPISGALPAIPVERPELGAGGDRQRLIRCGDAARQARSLDYSIAGAARRGEQPLSAAPQAAAAPDTRAGELRSAARLAR